MDLVAPLILAGHYGLLTLLCMFGAHRLAIAWIALRLPKPGPAPAPALAAWPAVVVQLPVYNEKYVIDRLIDAAARLDYPADKLSIQVLDDSTDETVARAAARVAQWRACGVQIAHIRRPDRRGFKAGALAHGLALTDAPYVAVFDADFLPAPGLLKQLVAPMADAGLAMVQARWDHINRQSGLLTQAQAIMLDAHFVIEQRARAATGRFFNFNGTAGLWRVAAITQAGGWQADTITEDLDLSYRAQLAGWRFAYLPETTCLSEVPPSLSAFKSQQHRWAKGGIEVMRKLLHRVWAAPLPLRHKLEATAHLSCNLAHLAMLLDSLVFLIPSLAVRDGSEAPGAFLLDILLFGFASLSHMVFYMAGQKALGRPVRNSLAFIPVLMAVSIALAVNNGRAVAEALAGRTSGFVRTPKSGETDRHRTRGAYRAAVARLSGWPELTAGLAYTLSLGWIAATGQWATLPFLGLFALGFLYSGMRSLTEPA